MPKMGIIKHKSSQTQERGAKSTAHCRDKGGKRRIRNKTRYKDVTVVGRRNMTGRGHATYATLRRSEKINLEGII